MKKRPTAELLGGRHAPSGAASKSVDSDHSAPKSSNGALKSSNGVHKSSNHDHKVPTGGQGKFLADSDNATLVKQHIVDHVLGPSFDRDDALTDVDALTILPKLDAWPISTLDQSLSLGGLTPVEFLTAVYQNPMLSLDRRVDAAKAVLPYVHKKLAVPFEGRLDLTGKADLKTLSDDELATLEGLLSKAQSLNQDEANGHPIIDVSAG